MVRGAAKSDLKKNFQNAILLLTGAYRHFYNRRVTGGGWLMRGGGRLRKGEHRQLTLQTSSQGGPYGKESWQDEEESPSEEKSRQEKEVARVTSEAIH